MRSQTQETKIEGYDICCVESIMATAVQKYSKHLNTKNLILQQQFPLII